MTESDPKDLVIAALKQRIGELVANYESDIAIIRASYTKLKDDFDHVSKVLAAHIEEKPDKTESKNLFSPVTKFIPPEKEKKETENV